MQDKFWEGGAAEYARVLTAEFNRKRDDLSAQLQLCSDDGQRAAIQQKMDHAKSEYDRKISEIDQSLY